MTDFKFRDRRRNAMKSLNDMFFSSATQEVTTYEQILEDVQKYCTTKHSDKLTTEGNQEEARKLLREFIKQYIVTHSQYRMIRRNQNLC